MIYMNQNPKETEVYTLNSFTQIINYIMYIIDLIRSWLENSNNTPNNGVEDDNNNEVQE